LARNAVEAARRGDGDDESERAGGLVRVTAMRTEDGRIAVEICDDGPGVPEHLKPKLFDAFQSGARPGGTGLGLSIAAELAHMSGGTLTLAEPGGRGADDPCRGARFVLTLPA
ncbi:MAG: ATP-binding protein, partial [Hyphomicrobiales bacterium]|nr:ATP-binding protein [Hyphomicrobiales bacterium]